MTQPNGASEEREVISGSQWLFLLVAVALASISIRMSVDELLSEQPFTTQQAAVFSAGKKVGVSGEMVLVSFIDGTNEKSRAEIMKKYGLQERGYIPEIGVHQFVILGEETPAGLAKKIQDSEPSSIEFAEPDYLLQPAVLPDDPWFANWQKNKVQIQAPLAWDIHTGTESVVVGIADTGVACAHEDLAPNCISGRSFVGGASTEDVNGHGTAVAGVAGGAGNNGLGVAGGAWDVSLLPLLISDASGAASYSTIAKAVTYAADQGARVVNNSYQSGGSFAVQKAAKYLWGKGGVLVVSEGNYATDSGTPANQYIVSVGAVDSNDNLYSWSSYGKDVDVVAPGCTGATTAKAGGYGSFCGTSSASPEVAGLLALIFSVNPALSPQDAVTILTTSADDLGSSGWDNKYGSGRINMYSALTQAQTYTPTSGGSTPTKGQGKNSP